MVDIAVLLQAAQSQEDHVRQPAEKELHDSEVNHFAAFLGALVELLGTNSQPDQLRMAAALQIKRVLTGQDDLSQRTKAENWRNTLDDNSRGIVKNTCLTVLAGASVMVSKQAAQCVEAVARLELPDGNWSDLPEMLLKAIDQAASRDVRATVGPLLALGYFANVAANCGFEIPEAQTNQLLGKISQGMNNSVPADVQTAATQALSDTLEFAKHNMDSDNERNMIMSMIFTMTKATDPQTREKAFQCLTTVLQLYYHHLEPHMVDIWECTTAAIKNSADEEGVARQALNFWDEMALEEAEREAAMNESGTQPSDIDRSRNFTQKVRDQITQLVLHYCLLQQPEEPDDEEGQDDTLYAAAEHCFSNLCACLHQSILEPTMQFVKENHGHSDWRRRQAALFAFGAIINALDAAQVRPYVAEMFESVLSRSNGQGEPVGMVRETATWAISNVCSEHLQSVSQMVNQLIIALVHTLKDIPRVAHMGATAFHNFFSMLIDSNSQSFLNTSANLFESLASELWTAAIRPDNGEWKLLEDAFEALIRLVEAAPAEKEAVVGDVLIVHSLKRLDEIRTNAVEDSSGYQEVELCDLVGQCIMKLDSNLLNHRLPNVEGQFSLVDKIVETMMHVLQRNGSSAHANALQTIGEVTRIVGDNFQRYKNHVCGLALAGLGAHTNAQTCVAAVRLCSDICSALGKEVINVSVNNANFVELLLQQVFSNLASNNLDRDVKPPHLTVLADVAMAIEIDGFRRFFELSMKVALDAAGVHLDVEDEDLADYLNNIREAALEAIEIFVLDATEADLGKFLAPLAGLCKQIAMEVQDSRYYYQDKAELCPPDLNERPLDYKVSEAVMKPLLGTLAEVAGKSKTFAQEIHNSNQIFGALFSAATQSSNSDLRETADYAKQKLSA